MEYSVTQRGHRVLIYKGFEFIQFRVIRGIVTWRCRNNRATKCHSVMKTKDGNIIEEPTQHCHDSCPQKNEVNAAKRRMQEAMRAVSATPRNVMGNVLTDVNTEALAYMPKKSSLSRNLLHYRSNGHLPEPNTVNFEIPQKYKDLVLHDSGINDPERILVLGSNSLLKHLDNAIIFGDGTFDKVPKMFYQLYTWHAQVGNSYPPCVYFLLQKKTAETYNRMFNILKILLPNISPEKILLDFEKAAMNSAKISFPLAEVKGCYFHLSQSLVRKINSVGLKTVFESNLEKKLKLKSLAALSFVPPSEVKIVFNELAATFPEENNYTEVLNYFYFTYIEGAAGRNAQFPIALWNHYDTVLERTLKTTNCCEGFHNALNSLFHCSHPSIWFLLDGLQRDLACHRLTVANAETGRQEIKNKRYESLYISVLNAVQEYSWAEDKIAYLQKLANLQ